MLDLNTHIWELILTGAMGVGGWFLSTMHKDVRDNTESIGKLKGKTDVIKTSTDIHIEQLTKGIEELKDSIIHLNNNYQIANKGISDELRTIKEFMSNGQG